MTPAPTARITAHLRAAFVALALAASARAALAGAETRRVAVSDRFDGTWAVEILTEAGACDRVYRYPVRIERGQARFVGVPLKIQGGVAGDGTLHGSISNGLATAAVAGCLAGTGTGRGTWASTGALQCRGRWIATRRR